MDYAKPERSEALSAAYVAGVLRGGARRRFETLLTAHPALIQAVARWEARLMPMTAVVEPVAPSPQVWASIQRRVGWGQAATAGQQPRRKSFSWWQTLTGVASLGTLALAVVLAVPRPVQPPIVVVLVPSGVTGEPTVGAAGAAVGGAAGAAPGAASIATARFVASITADGRGLVLRPLEPLQLGQDRSLELWAVPPTGAPRSLGLVDQAKGATVLQARLLQDTAAFAVSVEPRGGSPTGAPTGPVISVGKLGA